MRPAKGQLLLAVDLEEFYIRGCEPAPDATSLTALVGELLALFSRSKATATFFTVGEVARRYPDLIQAIAAAGHEIACHGDRHVPLTRMDAREFRDDLRRNQDAVAGLGLPLPVGFRAPLLSLGRKQSWAFEVLQELGFVYSSSVMPARTPLAGWPEFGGDPRVRDGVLEIPVSIARVWPLRIPVFSGVYYRLLPEAAAHALIRREARRRHVCGYVHPYDIDHRQPITTHAELHGRPLMNRLLFMRRGSLAARLERLLAGEWDVTTYRDFARKTLAGVPQEAS